MPGFELFEFTGILRARMTSSRLPGKILMEICGEPIAQLMFKDYFTETV